MSELLFTADEIMDAYEAGMIGARPATEYMRGLIKQKKRKLECDLAEMSTLMQKTEHTLNELINLKEIDNE